MLITTSEMRRLGVPEIEARLRFGRLSHFMLDDHHKFEPQR